MLFYEICNRCKNILTNANIIAKEIQKVELSVKQISSVSFYAGEEKNSFQISRKCSKKLLKLVEMYTDYSEENKKILSSSKEIILKKVGLIFPVQDVSFSFESETWNIIAHGNKEIENVVIASGRLKNPKLIIGNISFINLLELSKAKKAEAFDLYVSSLVDKINSEVDFASASIGKRSFCSGNMQTCIFVSLKEKWLSEKGVNIPIQCNNNLFSYDSDGNFFYSDHFEFCSSRVFNELRIRKAVRKEIIELIRQKNSDILSVVENNFKVTNLLPKKFLYEKYSVVQKENSEIEAIYEYHGYKVKLGDSSKYSNKIPNWGCSFELTPDYSEEEIKSFKCLFFAEQLLNDSFGKEKESWKIEERNINLFSNSEINISVKTLAGTQKYSFILPSLSDGYGKWKIAFRHNVKEALAKVTNINKQAKKLDAEKWAESERTLFSNNICIDIVRLVNANGSDGIPISALTKIIHGSRAMAYNKYNIPKNLHTYKEYDESEIEYFLEITVEMNFINQKYINGYYQSYYLYKPKRIYQDEELIKFYDVRSTKKDFAKNLKDESLTDRDYLYMLYEIETKYTNKNAITYFDIIFSNMKASDVHAERIKKVFDTLPENIKKLYAMKAETNETIKKCLRKIEKAC